MSTQSKKASILLVDDNPDKLLAFKAILEELREHIVTANSGEEALKYMLEYEFAVILLDVKMPTMDGFETARLIRGRRKFAHTPIIFVTAYEDEMHTSEGYSLGAVDYILTPVIPEVLRTKVKVFVQLFRMRDQVARQAEQRIALAQEQAARAAAEQSIRRSAFLAEASQVLVSSLDAPTTLKALARFVVPFLGDFCALALVDEAGRVRRTEMAWQPEANATARGPAPAEATVQGIVDEAVTAAIHRSLGTGKAEFLDLPAGCTSLKTVSTNIRKDRARLEMASGSAASLPAAPPPIADVSRTPDLPRTDVPPAADVVALGFALQHVAIFPLRARGRKLGALMLGAARRLAAAELALAAELADRAAIALDNALLYSSIQEADQRKDEFLAMLAHELRNPLAPIRSAVAVMRRLGSDDPTLQWSRDIIDRQVEHMTRLVDDLLDVSRLTQGKIRLDKAPVALAAIVERAVETSRPAIDGRRHSFTVTLPPAPVYLDGDAVRLAQVFTNLLNNAAKYTPEGGVISLTAEGAAGEQVVLRVRDNGSGIPREALPHVFDLFTQANRSLARSEGGLGIGLTLVKSLVEKHGGQVEAKSEGAGQGSEFTVRLPVLTGAPAEAAITRKPRSPHKLSLTMRILLIDDNVDSNDALETLLLLNGHDVRTATDGTTALQQAREFKPQLILCDLGLPGMDGYEVIKRLHQQLREQADAPRPVIAALTGYAQTEDLKRSREAGFDHHLVKPIDADALQELIVELAQKFGEADLVNAR